MISNDLLLTIASIMYVVCAVPQVIKNLRFKDTITQSIMSNSLILFASIISLIAYLELDLYFASIFLVLEVSITSVLLFQIIVWGKHKRNKKLKEAIKKTEGVRTFIRTVKGVK